LTLSLKKEAGNDNVDYGWIRVDIPEDITKQCIEFGKEIPEEELYIEEDNDKDWGFGREVESHITVKYGLHTKDEEEVKSVLEGQKGGEVELSNIGIFENDDYDVVKVDIKSPDLHRLNKQISDNLEATDSHPTYHPHITIAYVKPGEGKKYKGSDKLSGKKFSFDKVVFEDSDDNPTTIQLD